MCPHLLQSIQRATTGAPTSALRCEAANVKCSQWNDCEQVCTDSEKGFLCSCRGGYKLNLNGYTCDDIDECQNEAICQHECVNTVGSYRCYCDVGFRLNVTDGRSCIADSTCNGSCEHACAFVRGRYRCVCNKGYLLARNHKSCQYIGTTSSSGEQTTSTQPELSTTSQPSFIAGTKLNSLSDLTTSNEADYDVTTVTTSTASRSYTTSALALYMCAHALFVMLSC
ncbi:hypothetical protein NP493_1258g00040 [Ridgeia piscesae]|uniref:EGF-like domain-containing protein n=1 Tax=Ridgeia piscesae TaxID=27915 RepID=A0AAD9KAN6_RIDPI|nr:hypothetical protein NP493_1258g00040 [Ridgeia piscesae]